MGYLSIWIYEETPVQSLKEEIMAGYAARKEALKAGHELPLSNLESLEIHAFCQVVALHQDSAKSSGILGRTINQSDKKSQYPLTASQALIDENKEIKYDTAGVLALNQQELVEYLESGELLAAKADELPILGSHRSSCGSFLF